MKRHLLSMLLVLVLLTCVCCNSHKAINDQNLSTDQDKYTYQAKFDVFTDEVFDYYVTKDSITLNYTLANPENYNITDYTPTFGNFTKEANDSDTKVLQEYYDTVKTFDRDLLTTDQQLTYDILKQLLENTIPAGDFYYMNEVLSPTTGLQAQLPVLLAEYHFYEEKNVKDYLKLLTCIDEYFNQICTFEQEKSQKGLFMNDTSAKDIIAQCQEFINDPDNNYLITTFSDRLEGIVKDEGQKKAYIEENKAMVKNHIIPAYEKLISTLTSLKGTGKNEGGLCNFEDGKAYYEFLVRSTVGSYRSIDDIHNLLSSYLTASILRMQTITSSDQSVIESISSPKYKYTDPEEIMTYLKDSISNDFPAITPVNCTIKYVHKSLEEYMSPAFYLTPPIDKYTENMVYINKASNTDMSNIFTTIAHEGYPGHLYQTVYYQQQFPSLLRNVIDFGGYSEGWATYVERYSYGLGGLNKNVAEVLQNNLIATLCIYGNVDVGINYYGWDKDKTSTYLKSFGIADETAITSIYNAIVAEPCNYLKYILGYLEINEMKIKAQNSLGDEFVLKDFHTFFLDMGPTQFNLMNTYLDKWLEEKKK